MLSIQSWHRWRLQQFRNLRETRKKMQWRIRDFADRGCGASPTPEKLIIWQDFA